MSKIINCLIMFLIILAGVSVCFAVVCSARPPDRDDVLEEMTEINGQYSRKWDEVREQYPEGPERDKARLEWRKLHREDLRNVYHRRGMKVPEYLESDVD